MHRYIDITYLEYSYGTYNYMHIQVLPLAAYYLEPYVVHFLVKPSLDATPMVLTNLID